MVQHYLWPKNVEFLCIMCLEQRIGRLLNVHDFLLVYGNIVWKRSGLLKQRMVGFNDMFDEGCKDGSIQPQAVAGPHI